MTDASCQTSKLHEKQLRHATLSDWWSVGLALFWVAGAGAVGGCQNEFADYQEDYSSFDAIFVGTVVRNREATSGKPDIDLVVEGSRIENDLDTILEIDHYWKGVVDAANLFRLRSIRGDPSFYRFVEGQRYLVFASQVDGHFVSYRCSPNALVHSLEEVNERLRAQLGDPLPRSER